MTLAEAVRATESYKRRLKDELKQKAAFDYITADLIGRSVSRIYSSTARMPKLYEVYPSLFDDEETEEAQQRAKDELTAARFKQFAAAFNSTFKGGKNGE